LSVLFVLLAYEAPNVCDLGELIYILENYRGSYDWGELINDWEKHIYDFIELYLCFKTISMTIFLVFSRLKRLFAN